MAKECKSCGNFYKGDYCDKCGYGKKVVSKSAAKYKKATKPERFRTAEDSKLYAEWDKEREQQRKSDPNRNKKFLVLVLIVFVAMVLFVLYQSGAIFSNTRNEVIEQYFNAVQTKDYDKFVKCHAKEIRNEYESDRKSMGLSKSEAMEYLYADLDELYGEGFTINVEFGRETQLDKDEYDLTEYKEQYGTTPSISDAYEMYVTVTFSGSKAEDTVNLYIYVVKTSGYWRIIGMSEDNGIVNEDTGLVQPETEQTES